jgi:hypothetical protein
MLAPHAIRKRAHAHIRRTAKTLAAYDEECDDDALAALRVLPATVREG